MGNGIALKGKFSVMRLTGLVRHKAFVGHVAAMMSGKSIAAAIALFTTPIVARLFSPADFGVAGVFLSIIGIISNVAALRYEAALVLPKQDTEALTLMAISCRIVFFVCLAMLLFIAVVDISGVSWRVLDLLGQWKWYLPMGVLLMAVLQIQEHWIARKKGFKVIAASLVVGTGINSATRIGVGLVGGTSVYGLIGSNLLGMSCRIFMLNWASSNVLQSILMPTDSKEIRRVASRYSDFPKLNAPASLVFSTGQNLPVLLFGVMFSPAVAGFYAMANRLANVPIAIVANSVRRVFLQKAAAVHNKGKSLHKAYLLSTCTLALLGAVPFGILWFAGQPMMGWLLGERWLEAGRYLEIIAPWLFMLWVTAPTNPVFVVLRKQKLWLSIQIATTLMRLGAFGLGFAMKAGAEWTLQAFVIATVAANVTTIIVAITLIMRQNTYLADHFRIRP